MEMHPRVNSVPAKRLWNILRVAFYMMRKGLLSKRKLLMDINLMMKRGKVLGKKTLSTLMFHHHHHHSAAAAGGFGPHEYEFSCSNSPNPSAPFHFSKRKHQYRFPCINVQDEEEPDNEAGTRTTPEAIDYLPEYSFRFPLQGAAVDVCVGEKMSPAVSPLSVRVSNYSGAEEMDCGGREVDTEAEEFINRFYEQLRVQQRSIRVQYQQVEYEEMLARGTR